MHPDDQPSSKPLRIALVCDWFRPRTGGIEMHLEDLAGHLLRAGHEPHLITATPGENGGYPFPVHRLSVPIATRFGFVHTLEAFRKVDALLSGGAFDIVHCHGSILSPLAYGSAYLAQRRGIPTLVTCHSILSYYRRIFRLLDGLMHWSRWPVLYAAVSPTAAGIMRGAGRTLEVHVLPNAVDESQWRLPPAPKDPGEILIVSVMRLSIRKRAHVLIRMLPDLLPHVPANHRLRLVIAGDGRQKPRLVELVGRLGLENVVEFTGTLTRTEIAVLYARADIFVLPTKQEAFGLAALEARAAGLPVVGMMPSGLQDMIEHGREGLLASSDRELQQHLVTLISDLKLRQRISRHNRTTPTAWTWSASLARHLDLYRFARKGRTG
jgi:glycosyltransferase involved in cell wall biosynthesis